MKILVLFLIITSLLTTQSFETSYYGWHGDTNWVFHFKNNGTFIRESYGHFGRTTVKGKYTRVGDTITITKGYKNTYKTIAKKYIIGPDSKLVNAESGYDYAQTGRPDTLDLLLPEYISGKRKP